LNGSLSRRAIVSSILILVVVRYGRDLSGGWVWLKVYYCLHLLGGVCSIVGQLHVFRFAFVGGGYCVEIAIFFVVTTAYLYEFTVSRGVRYLTSVLVPCRLKGFPTMNTVALSMSHFCILITMCS